ncbi:MAG: sugar transferase [Clostridia bacterium]
MYRKRNQITEMMICLVDALVVVFCLTVAGMMRYQTFEELVEAENLRELYSIILVLHIASFYFLKVYNGFFKRGRYRELLLSLKYNLVLVAGATLVGFGMKSVVFCSRLVMGYFFVFNTGMLWLVHLFIRNRERFFGWSRRRESNLLIVTTREYLTEILERFGKSKEVNWKITGVVLLGQRGEETEINGIPIFGETDDYLEYATLHVVDEVFIQVDEIQKREKYLKNMILEFEKMGVVVNLNLDLFDLGVNGVKQVYNLEQYHVLAFSSRLFDYRMVLIKRMIDIAGALVGLLITGIVGIVLAPFLLLESPGPLIFCQNRVGVNGRIFKFYKFRSMYVDAEERKKELMSKNEVQGLMFKMENDPRITKVGAFIRKTSIDELRAVLERTER